MRLGALLLRRNDGFSGRPAAGVLQLWRNGAQIAVIGERADGSFRQKNKKRPTRNTAMAGPAAFTLLAFIGSIGALLGVYGATGAAPRPPETRYPLMG
jgi:hypothetical protein